MAIVPKLFKCLCWKGQTIVIQESAWRQHQEFHGSASHAKADYKTKISGCKPLSVISTRNNPTVDLKMVGLEVEVFHLPIKEERWSYVESKLHQQCNARSVEGEEMGRAHRWRRPQRFDSRCLSCPWRPLCCRAWEAPCDRRCCCYRRANSRV